MLHRVVDLQDRELGAIRAVLLDVLLLDDRECLHDVVSVIAVDAVEVEEGGVKLATEQETPGVVPAERGAVVAAVTGEGGEVPGRKSQFEDAGK